MKGRVTELCEELNIDIDAFRKTNKALNDLMSAAKQLRAAYNEDIRALQEEALPKDDEAAFDAAYQLSASVYAQRVLIHMLSGE